MTNNKSQQITTPPRTIRKKTAAGTFLNFEGYADNGNWLYSNNGRTMEISPSDIGKPGQGHRFTDWDE